MSPRSRFDHVLDHLRRWVALRACLEVGAFSALRTGAASATSLAQRLEVEADRLELHLNACVQQGLLRKDGERFSLVPGDESLFGEQGPFRPELIGPLEPELRRWSAASQVLRGGARGPESAGSGGPAPLAVRLRFHRMLAERSAASARWLAATIGDGGGHIADVGAGSGLYGLELLRRMPRAELTAIDLPAGAEVFTHFADEAGLRDRSRFAGLDITSDALGGPYSTVVVSNVVHLFDADTNRDLLARCVDALAPGGTLVVKDYVVTEDGTQPEHGALFPVLMAVWGHGGRTWPASTISDWLCELGLITEIHQDGLREESYAVRARGTATS